MSGYNGTMLLRDRTDLAAEHALDVLAAAARWQGEGARVALAVLTGTQGGSVRAPGAMMAVSEAGSVAGYLSGGCVDADLALRAAGAIRTGQGEALRYGQGSPFIDIRLPCGGALDVALCPNPDPRLVRAALARLDAREPVELGIAPACGLTGEPDGTAIFRVRHEPKLRLRLAGRGADALALARTASAAGIPTELWTPEEETLDHARRAGLARTGLLGSPASLPDFGDDAWTAFVLLLHDRDWDVPLLKDALAGPAFHVGAVGSKRTQASRREALLAAGVPASALARLRGPIGLVPGMRDASMLAVSALAGIVADFHARAPA